MPPPGQAGAAGPRARPAVSWGQRVPECSPSPGARQWCQSPASPLPRGYSKLWGGGRPCPTSVGWLSPPCAPGSSAGHQTPRAAAPEAPPREVPLPQSWGGPGPSFSDPHAHIPTTTKTPEKTQPRSGTSSGTQGGGAQKGGEAEAGRAVSQAPGSCPAWAPCDSQRLQARQLPQRVRGDSSQLVVLQHPVRGGQGWRSARSRAPCTHHPLAGPPTPTH